MRKHFSRIPLIIFLISIIVLAACSQAVTVTPEFDNSPQPTATEDFVPVLPKDAEEIVILSIEEDGYGHLFAYIPNKMPLTRLTNGDWDDITPAAHPSGESIAFASNRFGQWDLYQMDLSSGELTRLTNTPAYEGAPSWSPDGTFIAYESYRDENLEIVVGPIEDTTDNEIRLTTSPASDHSPAWAPGGRQIAFISNGDVILADLDKPNDQRFQNISNSPLASESHPVWSPDGAHLAWASQSQSIGRSGIYVWDAVSQLPAVWIGDGDFPAWNTSGDQIITTVPAPNTNFIITYSIDGTILQTLTPFPYQISGLIWENLIMSDSLPREFEQAAEFTPAPLWAASGAPLGEGVTGRWSLIDLNNVQAPYPQLHDLADEAFSALRTRVIEEVGWDALASLENAFVPITSNLDPGFGEDWLYTGRAFAINTLMTNAGWMVAVREDYGAQTYWRLYLRTQAQDGSLGIPLHDLP
ncbi:MAG TPA: hypothetical protein VLA72_09970, partial [Anaerolineales bacterium]|nr:hypothetical protein [Anaerolineales bacterium]